MRIATHPLLSPSGGKAPLSAPSGELHRPLHRPAPITPIPSPHRCNRRTESNRGARAAHTLNAFIALRNSLNDGRLPYISTPVR